MAELLVLKSEEASTQININTECISKQEIQIVEKTNEHPGWLPDGWTVDVKTRRSGVLRGSGYKCYIDPLKGYKFYSKPEVLRYLDIIKDNSCTPKKPKRENRCTLKKEKNENSCTPKEDKKENSYTPKEEKKDNSCTPKEEKRENSCTLKEEKEENGCTPKDEKKENYCTTMEEKKDDNCTPKKEKKCSNIESPSNVVIEKSAAEGFPPGWLKVVRIKTNANGSIRKDPV